MDFLTIILIAAGVVIVAVLLMAVFMSVPPSRPLK